MTREQLGQRLIREGLISEEQRDQALSKQNAQGGFLGDILIGLGAITEAQFQREFAAFNNVPYYDEVELLDFSVEESLFRGVPYQVALNRLILPLSHNEEGQLSIACLSPPSEELLKQLKFQTQSKEIAYGLSSRQGLYHAIRVHYSRYIEQDKKEKKEAKDKADAEAKANAEDKPNEWDLANPLTTKEGFCTRCGSALAEQAMLCPQCGHLLEQPARDPLRGRILEDRWKLLGRLGEGGMGMVYEGINTKSQRPIAIKLLRSQASLTEKLVQRFYHEAQILKKLEHKGIIEVYRFGFEPSLGFYIVMELLHGCSLDEYILQNPEGMSAKRLCEIFVEVCDAMHYAHQHKVIHRDLKPENIYICQNEDGTEHVKVLDFGIAKNQEDESSLTQTGMTMGTPRYLSPEQAMGSDVEARSDVYSLCVILFEVLTGEGLFSAESPYQFAMRHVYDQPPTLEETRPYISYPQAIHDLLSVGLAKRIHDRPEDMLAVKPYLSHAIDALSQKDLLVQYEEDSYFTAKQERKKAAIPAPAAPIQEEKKPNILPPPIKESISAPPKQEVIRRPHDERNMQQKLRTPTPNYPMEAFREASDEQGAPSTAVRISSTRQRQMTPYPSFHAGVSSSDSLPVLKGVLLDPRPSRHTSSAPLEKKPTTSSKMQLLWILVVLLAVAALIYTRPFQKKIGYLEMTCKPEGAVIHIGEKTQLPCPVSKLPLEAGGHTIKVSKKGYETREFKLDIQPGQNHRLNLDLSPNTETPPTKTPSQKHP